QEWEEGQELIVEEAPGEQLTPEAIDQWTQEMNALCADSDPEDEARMQAAIEEHRREGKNKNAAKWGCLIEPLPPGHGPPWRSDSVGIAGPGSHAAGPAGGRVRHLWARPL